MKTLLLAMILALSACSSTPPRFHPGDVVEARNFSAHPHYNGTPVVVTGAFGWRWIKGPTHTLQVYEITTTNGEKLAAQEFQLKTLEKRD
jgi:hypothetical protein